MMTENQLKAWEDALLKDAERLAVLKETIVAETAAHVWRSMRGQWWFHSAYCFLCGAVAGAGLMKMFLT